MWHLVRCEVSESQVHSHWGTHGWNHCHVLLKSCCSYLWCRMSSLSANKKTHGCVICNNEYAFGVCIEMEWVWVTMTNSSKWSWSKCLLLSCDEFFCTLLVKSIGVLQFSVSLLSVLMVHHQHCMNTKTSNVDKCVFVLKICVSPFFPSEFFHDSHSLLIITFTKRTHHNMNLHTFTYRSYTNAISFTKSKQQKCLSNEKVAHDGFTNHW